MISEIFFIHQVNQNAFSILWDLASTGKRSALDEFEFFDGTPHDSFWMLEYSIMQYPIQLQCFLDMWCQNKSCEILRFSKGRSINYSITSNNIKEEVLKILINVPLTETLQCFSASKTVHKYKNKEQTIIIELFHDLQTRTMWIGHLGI